MGASSSITNGISNNIYISYDYRQNNNHFLKKLQNELVNLNHNIICSEITSEPLKYLTATEISRNIENILNHTSYFILCVSEETIRSFHQTIEINNALDSNKEILYLLMDKSYTPFNDIYVKGIIKNKKWMRLYDDEHLSDCLNYLSKLSL
jgi:hypothetical protein